MQSSVIGTALHRINSSHILHFPTLFVVCVGVGLSLLSYHIVAESEHVIIKRDLSQAARRIAVLLDKGLDKHRFELVSLQAFHDASEKITRNEFQRYVKSILSDASDIRALAWIPRVPGDRRALFVEEAQKNGYAGFQVREKGPSGKNVTGPQRDEYFPIYYIEPLKGNKDLVGLNVASEPTMAQILQRARDTKKVVATGKIELTDDDGKQIAFQLFIPVFSKDESTNSVGKLRPLLEGFYAGTYLLDKFVENSLVHESPLGIDVHIFDNTSPKSQQFLISYLTNDSPSPSLQPQDQASLHTGLHAAVPLTVGQRNWLVIAKPTPSFLRTRHTWKALMTLIGGLLATVLITGYFVLIQRGATRSQEFAAIQTRAKQELENEISERKLAEQTLLTEKKISDETLNSLPGIFYLFDEKGRMLRWNRNFEKFSGYSSQEVSERSPGDYFQGEDKRRVSEAIRRVFSEGESSVEAELISKDGTKTPYFFTGKRMLLDGKVCLVGMGTDITARKEAEEALRTSEAQLANAVEMAHLGHWELDETKNEFTFNDQFYKLFRTTAEQVGGYKMSLEDYARRFVHPEETSIVSNENRKAIETDDPHFSRDLEHRIVYADGEVGHISVRYFVVKDELGNTIRTYGVNQDITERKRIEEALRRSEERFRSLIEQAPDAIFVNDYDGRFLQVNELACTSLGYRQEELLSMSVSDIDPDFVSRGDHDIFWPNLPVTFEARHRRKDGSIFPVEIRLGSIDYGDSKVMLAMARDITERKLADQALQESEAKYRQLADVTFEGIAFHDHGVILQANDQFFEMFGYEPEELISTQCIDKLATPESAVLARDKIESGSTDLYEAVGVRKDGSEFPIEVRATYMESGDRRIRAVAIRDVSEQKDMEKRLLESQKMEAVGTLAGGIAHDFNNLLQIIHGYSDMGLLYIGKNQSGYKELVEIKKAAKSAAELTQGLLTYSRRVEGKLRPVNVNKELKHISKMLGRTIPKMIAIELNLDSDLWVVKADPAQLHQTVMNLAVNARDAMPDGGKIVIETSNVYLDSEFCNSHHGIAPGKYILLTVSDTGCGIDKATQEKIFDPFFTTKEIGKGTGLGLSIVFGIVKSHGGTISCSTAPGKGTTFRIYLPATEQSREQEEAIHSDSLIGGTETILVVDDEDAVRRLAENILGRFGYSVLTVSNGREALKVFQEQKEKISLIIMDLIMPEMGGRECLREIIRVEPSAKVLITSGYEADGQIEDALEEGAKASIKKPYEARELLEVVRRVLDDVQNN